MTGICNDKKTLIAREIHCELEAGHAEDLIDTNDIPSDWHRASGMGDEIRWIIFWRRE